VNKSAAAFIDANVITLTAVNTEKHQIAGPQSTQRDGLRVLPLRRGCSGHGQPNMAMHVVHKTTAIKPSSIRATVTIRYSQLAGRSVQKPIAGLRD
jgi:hypothetical protein